MIEQMCYLITELHTEYRGQSKVKKDISKSHLFYCPLNSLNRSSEFATWLPSEFPMSNGSLHVTMTILVFHLPIAIFALTQITYIFIALHSSQNRRGAMHEEGMWKIKIPESSP